MPEAYLAEVAGDLLDLPHDLPPVLPLQGLAAHDHHGVLGLAAQFTK